MEIVIIGLVVFGVGVGLAWNGYENRIGVWNTWYRRLAQLLVIGAIGIFASGGLTAATLVGLVFTVLLWTLAIFVGFIAGLVCLLGWLINLLSRK